MKMRIRLPEARMQRNILLLMLCLLVGVGVGRAADDRRRLLQKRSTTRRYTGQDRCGRCFY